jgi:hypothetical protein
MGGVLSLLSSRMATPCLIDRKTGKQIREVVSSNIAELITPAQYSMRNGFVEPTDAADVQHAWAPCANTSHLYALLRAPRTP